MKRFFFLILMVQGILSAYADQAGKVSVQPGEYPRALSNPMKGFRPNIGADANNHEYATLARHYIRWNELEDDESDTIQKILDFCNEAWQGIESRGIKVIPRVYLDWNSDTGNEYWPADMAAGDYKSPQFKQRLVRLIHRLGEAWDNDPRVAWIQVGLIGYWGEQHHPEPSLELQKLMGDAFSAAFEHKKFLVRRAAILADYPVGINWDRWADSEQMKSERGALGIQELNRSAERWKEAPMEGEVGYGSPFRFVQPGDDPDDTLSDPEHLDFLIDSIRDLHCSALGWISRYSQDDPVVRQGAEQVQKAFGYRFVIPEVGWSRRVDPEGVLVFNFSVINTGSAPFYANWPVAISLLDGTTHAPVWTKVLDDIDVRQWYPGDDWNEEHNVYREPAKLHEIERKIQLPDSGDLPPGEYILALAILDPVGLKPALRLATENFFRNGWHPFGSVGIGIEVDGIHELDPGLFDDPMKHPNLSYSLGE